MKRFILYSFSFSFFLCLALANSSFADVAVIGGLARDGNLEPGDQFEGIIHLRNDGTDVVQVNVYQTDYSFTANGQTLYGKPGRNPRSNAKWVTVSPLRITVASKAIASIYYTINVPQDPDLRGTYWSVVMIERHSVSGPPTPDEQTGKFVLGVQTNVRYAVQIVTNIRDTGDSNVRFMDINLIGRNGSTILQASLENVGERLLNPFLWAELYNKDGIQIGRYQSSRSRVFPNCSVRYLLDLSDVPKGAYTALVIVDNGDETVFGAKYDIHLK